MYYCMNMQMIPETILKSQVSKSESSAPLHMRKLRRESKQLFYKQEASFYFTKLDEQLCFNLTYHFSF